MLVVAGRFFHSVLNGYQKKLVLSLFSLVISVGRLSLPGICQFGVNREDIGFYLFFSQKKTRNVRWARRLQFDKLA